MNRPDEAELLARFRQKMSGIERLIPEPPVRAFKRTTTRTHGGPEQRRQRLAPMVALLAGVAALAIVLAPLLWAALPSEPGASSPPTDGTTAPAPTPLAVPTQQPPPEPGTPQACAVELAEGELAPHPDWGVALAGADGPPTRVLWPYGYAGRWDGDRLALIDGSGRAVAYVGDQVELGGGHTEDDSSFVVCGEFRVIVPAASPSPGIEITRDQAIELAFQNSEDPRATVRLAESGPLNRYLTVLGEPPDRAVWAVILDGTFPKECPAPGPCPDTPSKLVILDLFGRFVTSESPSPTSEPSPGEPAASRGVAQTLPTFAVDRNGVCQDFRLQSPVAGTLTGDPEDIDEPIWLRRAQGRHSFVWPAGFTVAFEPAAVLYDEDGQPVAREGGRVELPQVWQGQASGSNFNPYHAAGMLFGKCYAREGAEAVAIRSAAWRLDPAFGEPGSDTARLRLRAIGDACSGQPPAGDRLLQPIVEYSSDAVVISLRIAGIVSGPCAGPETEFSATIDLQEALGARRLLDGADEPSAERWPAAPFPVVEVADLGRSLEDRLEALVGGEGCAHVIDVDGGPWPIEEIERDAAELAGGVGLVGPGGSIYVGEAQAAAVAFGGFEAVHDGQRWGLVGPYIDQPWLTGFGLEGEWAAAEMAEIELSGGRSAWAAGIYVTVIGQEQCRE